MNVFELASDMLENKRDWESLSEEDKKAFNPFMVMKFMGMNQELCIHVNRLQEYIVLDNKTCYNLIKDLTPKGRKYLRYLSPSHTPNKELLEYVSKYYECSYREAEEYILLLTKKDLKEILANYSLDDKEISKILSKK